MKTSQGDCFLRKASSANETESPKTDCRRFAAGRKKSITAQEKLAVSLSPSRFHFPIGVHGPDLSLVTPEDPQTRPAALHAPDPDGLVGAAGYDQRQEELDAVDVVLVSQEPDERLGV